MNFIKRLKIQKDFNLLRNPDFDIRRLNTETLIEIYIEVMEELYSRDDYNSTQDLQLSYGIIKKILDHRGVNYVWDYRTIINSINWVHALFISLYFSNESNL